MGLQVQQPRRNGSSTSRQGRLSTPQGRRIELSGSGGGTNHPVECLARLEHGVHDDGELPRHRDSCPFEADPLPQLQPPSAQVTVGMGARQDHGCGLIKQPSQMGIAAPRDVAVIVNLSGLIAAGRQPQPRADRARLAEVLRILDGKP